MFAGQESFTSNIVYLSNAGSMLGQLADAGLTLKQRRVSVSLKLYPLNL